MSDNLWSSRDVTAITAQSPNYTKPAVKTALWGFKEGDKLLLSDAKDQRPETQSQEHNVGYEADIYYRK